MAEVRVDMPDACPPLPLTFNPRRQESVRAALGLNCLNVGNREERVLDISKVIGLDVMELADGSNQ